METTIPKMTHDEIRAWKVRMDMVSARMEREEAETPLDSVRNRAIAEAMALSAWERGWRPQHDPERAAEKIRFIKLLHGTAVHAPA